ncbi:MAG: PA-phosphatase, partial [Bacteroidetes bacterium]|nr:PA-phosphatase [Bacteroidota bacterium]
MKSLKVIGAIMFAATLYVGCKKDLVSENNMFPALEPLNTDTNAGNWKPILLSKPDEFAVNTPIAV